VYGAIAGFGVTFVSSLPLEYQTAIRVCGGVLLLFLGVESVRTESPGDRRAAPDAGALTRDDSSTFLLTITNPVTILAVVGIFTGLGVGISGAYTDAVALVGGVSLGSALWWLALSVGVSVLRARFTRSVMRWVSRVAGLVIVGFGLLALWGAT
jgi:threonine/homoserine/homoserine lactone efflux protein